MFAVILLCRSEIQEEEAEIEARLDAEDKKLHEELAKMFAQKDYDISQTLLNVSVVLSLKSLHESVKLACRNMRSS